MIWSDEIRIFKSALGGEVAVNPTANHWCAHDCAPSSVARAVENALEMPPKVLRRDGKRLPHRTPLQMQAYRYAQQASPVWIDACRDFPDTGDKRDVRRWIEGLASLPSGCRSSPCRPMVRLLDQLRREGVLLWPSMVHALPHPYLAGVGTTMVETGAGLTPFERELAIAPRRSASFFFMANSPAEAVDELSTEAILFSFEMILGSRTFKERRASNIRVKLQMLLQRVERLRRADGSTMDVTRRGASITRRIDASNKPVAHRFGKSGGRPDASVWIGHFELLSQSLRLKIGYRLDNACICFLDYLSGFERMPLPRELDRSRHILGKDGYFSYLSSKRGFSLTTRLENIHFVASLFELLVNAGELSSNLIHDDDMASKAADSGSSNKLVVPAEICKMAVEVIRELADHAFGQADALGSQAWEPAGRRHSDGDYRRACLPATILEKDAFSYLVVTLLGADGSIARVLNPALLVALLWLFIIPNRGIQVRLLDSGEADEFVPIVKVETDLDRAQLVSADWVANDHPLATKGRRQGAIREIQDVTLGRRVMGFYVNTNKSQAGGHKDGQDRGLEIPMEDPVLHGYAAKLLRWQGTFNPVDRFLTRAQLGESQLMPTDGLKGKLPGYVFLFRHLQDANLDTRMRPLSHDQLSRFFNEVMGEVQERLSRRLAAEPSGGPAHMVPAIVLGRKKGRVTSCAFSIHGLRVTGLTALYEAGVPFWIISKIVAGHCWFFMTLRYLKPGAESVFDALKVAREQRESGDLGRLANEASVSTPDELAARFVSHGSSITTDGAQVAGLWLSMEDGICPNGATLCHAGGPKAAGNLLHGPVVGGARNCGLCRFFLSGPRFVAGQVARINAHFYRAERQAADLQELWVERRRSENQGQRSYFDDKVSRATASVDITFNTINARVRLLCKSLALARLDDAGEVGRAEAGTQGDLLVGQMTQGVVVANLEEIGRLGFLDQASRTASLLMEEDIQDASMHLGAFIDQLLEENGLEGVMHRLSRTVGRAAGAAFVESVRLQAPPGVEPDEHLDDVSNGRVRLFDLDLAKIAADLSRAAGRPLEIAPRIPDDGASKPKLIVAPPAGLAA